jgi:hypothetical protein
MQAGTQSETGRMGIASYSPNFRAYLRDVTFGGSLHVSKLASKSYNRPPEGQQTAVVHREILVK